MQLVKYLLASHCWSFSCQAFFSANAAAQASRKSSPRVTNEAVQKAVSAFQSLFFIAILFIYTGLWYIVLIIPKGLLFLAQAAALKGSDHRRATNVSARLDSQQKKLNLPILPTTTIGSFPQTMELRKARREYKAKKLAILLYNCWLQF